MSSLNFLTMLIVISIINIASMQAQESNDVNVAHSSEISKVSLSSNESFMISFGGKDAKIWNFQTGELLFTHKDEKYIMDIGISPDNKYCIIASRNYSYLINLPDLKEKKSTDFDADFFRFMPNGK